MEVEGEDESDGSSFEPGDLSTTSSSDELPNHPPTVTPMPEYFYSSLLWYWMYAETFSPRQPKVKKSASEVAEVDNWILALQDLYSSIPAEYRRLFSLQQWVLCAQEYPDLRVKDIDVAAASRTGFGLSGHSVGNYRRQFAETLTTLRQMEDAGVQFRGMLADVDFRSELRKYIHANRRVRGKRLSLSSLTMWVNDVLLPKYASPAFFVSLPLTPPRYRSQEEADLPDLPDSKRVFHTRVVSETVRYWLLKMGFTYHPHRKGAYVDGHERPDVIQARSAFVQKMEAVDAYNIVAKKEGRPPIITIFEVRLSLLPVLRSLTQRFLVG